MYIGHCSRHRRSDTGRLHSHRCRRTSKTRTGRRSSTCTKCHHCGPEDSILRSVIGASFFLRAASSPVAIIIIDLASDAIINRAIREFRRHRCVKKRWCQIRQQVPPPPHASMGGGACVGPSFAADKTGQAAIPNRFDGIQRGVTCAGRSVLRQTLGFLRLRGAGVQAAQRPRGNKSSGDVPDSAIAPTCYQ